METDPTPSNEEIERQYRTLRLTMDGHGWLYERYRFWAVTSQAILFACSILFGVTTFASDDFFTRFGLDPGFGRFVRGIASVFALVASALLLIYDWRGRAALHKASFDRWTRTHAEFRQVQPLKDQSWPESHRARLFAAYWTADKESERIPNEYFHIVKAYHLRKVEVSKLQSEAPGCPVCLLRVGILLRDAGLGFAKARHGDAKHASRHD